MSQPKGWCLRVPALDLYVEAESSVLFTAIDDARRKVYLSLSVFRTSYPVKRKDRP